MKMSVVTLIFGIFLIGLILLKSLQAACQKTRAVWILGLVMGVVSVR